MLSSWNATFAITLAGTLVLLMAVLENIRRNGRSPDRVWCAILTEKGAAVVKWLSPVIPPGSRVEILREMLPPWITIGQRRIIYKSESLTIGRGLTSTKLRRNAYIAALINNLLLPKRAFAFLAPSGVPGRSFVLSVSRSK